MPLSPKAQSVRELIDAHINDLKSIVATNPPDKEALILRAQAEYLRVLNNLGLSAADIAQFSSVEFLSMEWEIQALYPTNHEFLPFILILQLMVEHYLREYLSLRFPGFPWKAIRPSYSRYVSMFRELHGTTDTEKLFVNALERVGVIRNQYAHNLNYELQFDGTEPFKKYFASMPELFVENVFSRPIDEYVTFCHTAVAYLYGFVQEWRKPYPRPEPQPEAKPDV